MVNISYFSFSDENIHCHVIKQPLPVGTRLMNDGLARGMT